MHDIVSENVTKDPASLAISFRTGDPFRHVLIEDFLTEDFLKAIHDEFPKPEPEDMRSEFGRKSRKHAVHDITTIGPAFRRWDDTLRSPEFVGMLEQITGIDGLIHDPEYHGAGTHNNMNGQGMDVHIDFNLHRTTGYHRRLNLIIYLGPEWNPDWGGNLELHKDPWDRENDYFKSYPPFCNHAVLFETNEHSWHGFDHIRLPDDKQDVSRKSLTVYYYTKTRPEEERARKHGTIYVQKAIPDSVKPNEVLTPGAYRELEQIFKRRDNYLKGLYTRESNLLVRVEDLKFRVRQLEKRLESGADLQPGSIVSRIRRALVPGRKP